MIWNLRGNRLKKYAVVIISSSLTYIDQMNPLGFNFKMFTNVVFCAGAISVTAC